MTGPNMKNWREMDGAEEALAYLKLVRETDEIKFKEFLRILGEYQSKSITTRGLVSIGRTLFRAHPELLLGLNKFLPKEYNIDDPASVEEEISEDLLRRKVEMQRALAFVNKVKIRFRKEEHVYNEFMAVLNLYKQAGARIEEVALQISSLFVGHGDLMEDFSFFLPPSAKPKPLPSVARRPISQASPGGLDNANRMPRVQQMHPKEAGKRATSPTDGHGQGEDLDDGVPDHSPPKVKKQRRQTDEEEEVESMHVEVVPMHLSPMFKRQRTDVDNKEDEQNRTNHDGNQRFINALEIQTYVHAPHALPVEPSPLTLKKQWKKTGKFVDETDEAGFGECEDYQKEVAEKMDTHALQELHRKDSPPRSRMQAWQTDTVEEEKDTTHDSQTMESTKEAGEQLNVTVAQTGPQEHSPTKIRLQRNRTDIVEEENDTTNESGNKEPAKEGGVQLTVIASQKLSHQFPHPKIRMQPRKTVKVEEEANDKSYDIQSKDSGKEVGEQVNVRASQKLSQEHSPTKVRWQRKRTERAEDENDIAHEIRGKESAEGGEQMDEWASQKLCKEHPRKIRKLQQKRMTDELEEENDPIRCSENNDSTKEQTDVRVAQKLPQKDSPSKIRKHQAKTDSVGEESYATHQTSRKESVVERGKQTDACVSQKLTQEHPSLKIRKQQKNTVQVEEKDTSNHSESSNSAKEPGEQRDVCTAESSPQEYSPTKIRKQRRTDMVEEEYDATQQSGSIVSAKDTGYQSNVCALQISFAELWPHVIQTQQSEEEKSEEEKSEEKNEEKSEEQNSEEENSEEENSEEENSEEENSEEENSEEENSEENSEEKSEEEKSDGTTLQSGSEESLQEVEEETDLHSLQKFHTECSPAEIRRQQEKADTIEEEDVVLEHSLHRGKNQVEKANKTEEDSDETDQTGSEESEKETQKETVVDTSLKVPQKRSSARLAYEVIRKQSQAADTGLAVQAQSTFCLLEEEQRIIRLQQSEDKQRLLMQQRQHKIFKKIKETVQRSHSSESISVSLLSFSEEIMSCPELQALMTEVLEDQELEFSECKKCTASYYLLPKSYLKPLTTCCRDSERAVLNDSWVSAGYDNECKENLFDESSGSCKQIGREIASKRGPHDRRLYHEEKLSLCEDDQFELDLLRHTTANTKERLVRMVEDTRASHFCMQTFDWDEYLTPINFRCIERIYGDHGTEFIEEAQKCPLVSLPIILDRLKQKEEDEWPQYQAKMNKSWAEVHTKHYHKSLDYSRSNGRENENMQLCSDSFPIDSELNEDEENGNFAPAAGGSPEHLTPVLSFVHPDIEVMYNFIKFLLEEVNMTEEQFKKVKTLWSLHLESGDGVPNDSDTD